MSETSNVSTSPHEAANASTSPTPTVKAPSSSPSTRKAAKPDVFPISLIAKRYFLFDVDIILHVRSVHRICGVFVGGLPHVPHQNVFLGIPLELMPEEARLLVDGGYAYVVDDVEAHRAALWGKGGEEAEGRDGGSQGGAGMSAEERRMVLKFLEMQGREAAKSAQKKADERKDKALKGVKEKRKKKAEMQTRINKGDENPRNENSGSDTENIEDSKHSEATLFETDGPPSSQPPTSQSRKPAETQIDRYYVTPTTSSYLHLHSHSNPHQVPPPTPLLPPVPPSSYPLFAHLHAQKYFLAPGLRFGCQYMAYPGDPLRYHSHFLANGLDWDEEFGLQELVGGGRLGTGVKKSFVIGGVERSSKNGGGGNGGGEDGRSVDSEKKSVSDGKVRAFSIEWAGM